MKKRCCTLQEAIVDINPKNITLVEIHLKTGNEFKPTQNRLHRPKISSFR
jgi:hypothetical protein